jgi:CheY-like chemotaxis protein
LIAATGYNSQDSASRSRQAGFEYHLVKPLDLNRLQQILRELSARLRNSPSNEASSLELSSDPPPRS